MRQLQKIPQVIQLLTCSHAGSIDHVDASTGAVVKKLIRILNRERSRIHRERTSSGVEFHLAGLTDDEGVSFARLCIDCDPASEWNSVVEQLLVEQDGAALRRDQGPARSAPSEYEEGKEVLRMAMGQIERPAREAPLKESASPSASLMSPAKSSVNKRSLLAGNQDQLETLREERNLRELRFQQSVSSRHDTCTCASQQVELTRLNMERAAAELKAQELRDERDRRDRLALEERQAKRDEQERKDRLAQEERQAKRDEQERQDRQMMMMMMFGRDPSSFHSRRDASRASPAPAAPSSPTAAPPENAPAHGKPPSDSVE